MFDLEKYFLLDVRPTNLNGLNALNYIKNRADNVSPFTFVSNIENVSTAYFIRKNMLEACAVIEERWNGVFDADNWNIRFMQNVGNDNGETIIYGKNMQNMEIFEDWSSVVTRLYPVGYDGIMLPERYIESQTQYETPYTRTIDFQTELEEEDRTEENLLQELRRNAQAYINENQYPKVSYTTKSDINNTMEIGDTIKVIHPLATITTEVLEYEYNNISEKIKELTFGNYTRDIKKKFDNIKNTINRITQEVSNQQIAINQQTELINSLSKNGYVYIDDNEILILDKLPKEEAVNVWRWGLGGLGFSSNGYEGPFETAITMNGQINANFITTGTLSVNRIEGLANTLNEHSSNITAIALELGTLKSSIHKVADITTTQETNTGSLTFEEINQSEPIHIEIKPIGESIRYLYPCDLLFPSNDLFIQLRTLRFRNTTTNEIFDYELPDDLLYYDVENYDTFVLDYYSHTVYVDKKCKFNFTTREVELLEQEIRKEYEFPEINLTEGDYIVEVPKYDNTPYVCYLMSRLMIKNEYTSQFATKAEMNNEIKQSNNEINLRLEEKLDEETFTGANIMLAINNDSSSAQINADKIDLNGKEIDMTADHINIKSENFNVDENGNMSCSNANVTGGNINLKGTTNQSKFKIEDQDDSTSYVEIMPGGIRKMYNGVATFFSTGAVPLTLRNANNSSISTAMTGDAIRLNNNGAIILIDGENGNIKCVSLTQTSLEKDKKNFEKFNYALEIIKDIDIYKYNLKNEKDGSKRHIGFVIGDKYNYSEDVTSENNDGVDIYSFVSLICQGLKEEVEKRDAQIIEMKEKIEELEQRLEER
jgi:phage minor structural protein